MRKRSLIAISAFALLALANSTFAQDWRSDRFLHSTTLENGATMPLSTIYDFQYNGVNVCSVDGSPGGDESPELSWTNAPRGTRSFAVTAFDVTAGVVHWGMHDISASTAEFPQNAGVTGSSYGKQVILPTVLPAATSILTMAGHAPPG